MIQPLNVCRLAPVIVLALACAAPAAAQPMIEYSFEVDYYHASLDATGTDDNPVVTFVLDDGTEVEAFGGPGCVWNCVAAISADTRFRWRSTTPHSVVSVRITATGDDAAFIDEAQYHDTAGGTRVDSVKMAATAGACRSIRATPREPGPATLAVATRS